MAFITEEDYAKKLKDDYTPRQPQAPTKFEELKELDKKVKKPAKIFSYIYGAVGSLVMGTGMCLAMGVIGSSMGLGIVLGLAGIGLVSSTYPLHKKILNVRKEKYAPQIISKSNEIIGEQYTGPSLTAQKSNSRQSYSSRDVQQSNQHSNQNDIQR